MYKCLEYLQRHIQCVSSSRNYMHNQEKSNEKKKNHIASASTQNDSNANATVWEGVKAFLVNSDAAVHFVMKIGILVKMILLVMKFRE